MIVVDASAVVELLLNTPAGQAVADRVLRAEESVAAPQLLDLEVLQMLRRYSRTGELDDERGIQAVQDLADLTVTRYPHGALVDRIWDLRGNLTAYDAAYIALAEALDAPLLTRDRALAAAPGHGATVHLV